MTLPEITENNIPEWVEYNGKTYKTGSAWHEFVDLFVVVSTDRFKFYMTVDISEIKQRKKNTPLADEKVFQEEHYLKAVAKDASKNNQL